MSNDNPERPDIKGSEAGGEGPSRVPVVGIGASAGGLSAFEALLEAASPDTGVAWVLIQHMAPDRESQLADILSARTSMTVQEVADRTTIAADHVYLIAPGTALQIDNGSLVASPIGPDTPRTPIDTFFISLAENRQDWCGAALLSGAGTDGTLGLKAVKQEGGLTLAQKISTAEYDNMLLSAVRIGVVDEEVPVTEMPGLFVDFFRGREQSRQRQDRVDGVSLRRVIDLLRARTGHDFAGYKSSTLQRRIQRRAAALKLGSTADYLRQLQSDPEEASRLLQDLLIGVTQFFRNPDAFTALAEQVIQTLCEKRTADDAIRVWVPGCATGEEAYSIAILLHEQMGKRPSMPQIQVFASDIDEEALQFARTGRYPRSIAADVSEERLERFFHKEDGTYRIRDSLRETCLFAAHNLLRDPPFSRIDLIACRNLLIYLDNDLQKKLLPVLHYALLPGGFLFLGPSETVGQAARLFAEVDREHKIYRRVGQTKGLPDFPLGYSGMAPSRVPALQESGAKPPDLAALAGQAVLDRYAPAYVLINHDYEILEASRGTADYLELPKGAPRLHIDAMARSEIAIPLKAVLARAIASGRRDSSDHVRSEHGPAIVRIFVEPLPGNNGEMQTYLVVFQEQPVLQEGPFPTGTEEGEAQPLVEALERELHTTKERLQNTTEELETSNEELKAANEELSSVNEELQSSNEELETSKEELQSINEELRTVNQELNARVDDLSRANADLKNLLQNTQVAILFLDRVQRIMSFTPPAQSLFHLRDHDVGRPLAELSGRLDYSALEQDIETVFESGEQLEREVETTDERPLVFLTRIVPYRDMQEKMKGTVLTLVDITEQKRSERHLTGLVAELSHRVKNTLAIVQAVCRETQRTAPDMDAFVAAFERRLRAMAAAHSLLGQTEWRRVELADLVGEVLGSLVAADRYELDGPDVGLHANAAVTLAMVLNELATNALKHGAWSTPEGGVHLEWRIEDAEEAARLRINWQEYNGPEVEMPREKGFGLRFVEDSIAHEFGGSSEIAFESDGLRCEISVALDSVTP